MSRCDCWDCQDATYKNRLLRDRLDEQDLRLYPDEYVPVRFPKAGKKKKRERTPGCPGNDGGSHVYVWTTYTEYYAPWPAPSYSKNWTVKMCAGCWQRPRKSIRFND